MNEIVHWLITIAVAIVAYRLGYRQGWKRYETSVMKALNRIAFKVGVPADHPFWSNHHEH